MDVLNALFARFCVGFVQCFRNVMPLQLASCTKCVQPLVVIGVGTLMFSLRNCSDVFWSRMLEEDFQACLSLKMWRITLLKCCLFKLFYSWFIGSSSVAAILIWMVKFVYFELDLSLARTVPLLYYGISYLHCRYIEMVQRVISVLLMQLVKIDSDIWNMVLHDNCFLADKMSH